MHACGHDRTVHLPHPAAANPLGDRYHNALAHLKRLVPDDFDYKVAVLEAHHLQAPSFPPSPPLPGFGGGGKEERRWFRGKTCKPLPLFLR